MQTWSIDGRDMTLDQLRKYKKNKNKKPAEIEVIETAKVLEVPKDILEADTGTESLVKEDSEVKIDKRSNKEELSPLKRFHQLKDRGYQKLPKTLRVEYKELKKTLNL